METLEARRLMLGLVTTWILLVRRSWYRLGSCQHQNIQMCSQCFEKVNFSAGFMKVFL